MRIRPTSVTVIGWFLVVTALLSLPSDIRNVVSPRESAMASRSPVPVPVQRAVSWLATAVNIVCGYSLLKGRNWARHVQIGWSVLLLSYWFFAAPYTLIILMSVAMECLAVYFLFKPQANAFFAVEAAGQPIQNELSKRQIASLCCYIAAGFWLACSAMLGLIALDSRHVLMLGIVMVPILVLTSVLLLIGKVLSRSPNWAKEIGIVLLASSAAGVVSQITLVEMFSSAEFEESLSPGKSVPEVNLTSAAIFVAVIASVGGLMFWIGERRNRTNSVGIHRKLRAGKDGRH